MMISMIDWRGAYRAATDGRAAAGYHHANVRVETAGGPVIVRRPIPGADVMDVRAWPEPAVLTAVAPFVDTAPRLLHSSDAPPYQVHEFVSGDVLHAVNPRGMRVPAHVPDDVARLFGALTRVPRERLPELPDGWPADGDTAGFGRLLSDFTAGVYERFRGTHARLYAEVGVPDDPTAPARARWPELTARPFVLVHADVHRKNVIVAGGRSTFIDWELALWADPVYEVAVHLHKMSYRPDERRRLVAGWLGAVEPELTAGWERDLDSYLAHERIKSAVVDTVRYAKQFAAGDLSAAQEAMLVQKLVDKLNDAYRYWGSRRVITAAELDTALRRAGAGARP